MSNNKEKLNELKSELEECISERKELINLRTTEGEVISLDVDSVIKLKGLELKMNSIREQIGKLIKIVSEEERISYGYTAFGRTMDNEGKYSTVSKVIPYHLKEKFLEEFDVLNSPSLPLMLDIEKFLENNFQ